MAGKRCEKPGCKAWAMRGGHDFCVFHRDKGREKDELEKRVEELEAANQKLLALFARDDAATSEQVLDAAREVDWEDPDREKAEAEVAAAKEKAKDNIAVKGAAFMKKLQEEFDSGRVKTLFISREEWTNWGGRYMLNGAKWQLHPDTHNVLPISIAEVIESIRKFQKSEQILELAMQLSDPTDMQWAMAGPEEANRLKTTGNMLPLNILNKILDGDEELAKRIIQRRGGL